MLLIDFLSENKSLGKKLARPSKPTYEINNGAYSRDHYVDSLHDDPAETDTDIARDYMPSGNGK